MADPVSISIQSELTDVQPTRRQRWCRSLANLATLGNAFCGMAAIWLISVMGLEAAAIWGLGFIMLAAFLDAIDGTLARMGQSNQRIGAWLDAMADSVTFVSLPALAIGMSLGSWGWVAAVFAAAGYARLLRFVFIDEPRMHAAEQELMEGLIEKTHTQSRPRTFRGLPTPAAGLLLWVGWMVSQTPWMTGVMCILLAVLMVVPIRVPHGLDALRRVG